ncbi:MAG TPA: hypothetical protein VKX29_03745 [Brumimicrobium sp.]|nr:hypothetical protein [Brumimicrobium sp.]
MIKHITYNIIVLLFLFSACQNKDAEEVIVTENPPHLKQLVNWSTMNKRGWSNMSFPIWFSRDHIDSLDIERIELDFTNFNFTDSSLSVSDTLPYRKIFIDFRSNGEVKKVVIHEMSAGIKIAEFIFSYKAPLDSFGYSSPAISSNVKYRTKSMLSLFSTFQELQQYKRLVLIDSDTNFLSYLDKSSLEETHHYFILDSAYWNVSFIDKEYTPEGKNVFYYGSPSEYISSFALVNLVEKTMKEERSFYPTKILKSQSFYANEFITKRFYTYDSIGKCIGFNDSLVTTSNDFLHLEKGVIEYKNNYPKSLHYYNEEDTLMISPIKRIKLNYQFKK